MEELQKQPCELFSERVFDYYSSRLQGNKIDIGRYCNTKPCCTSCLGALCMMFPKAFAGIHTKPVRLQKPVTKVYKVTTDWLLCGNAHNFKTRLVDSTAE